MSEFKQTRIAPAEGKLAVLLPGMGAVATTFIAGVEATRRGLGKPIGSLTQMAHIRLGKRSEKRWAMIKDLVPLATLDDLVFGGWDPIPDDAYTAASKAKVLSQDLLSPMSEYLSTIRPMPAVFDHSWVKRLDGKNVKTGKKRHLVEQIEQDIRAFLDKNKCTRAVMVWCASTEAYCEAGPQHQSLEAFEKALDKNDPAIAPSQIYAYAAIRMGIPYLNGAPNLSADFPAMIELAERKGTPIGGKDFKTGQTLMKTIIAPGLKARMLGMEGWFSTNILGNRDGEVLDDPANFKTKEVSKLSVLEQILEPSRYPDLYRDLQHKVSIHYYKPRGDNKEGWDNIDIVGWMGYPMQIKVNFLCRDSILAAPIVLDLALFGDLAKRAGMKGIQEWLSFYFKSPQHAASVYPEHDLFAQKVRLENNLRYLIGEELINYLGSDYTNE
ncbi:MAG: inositol-3-phosphate synthase [Deltaproteobacteria bacterium]|nr:MAG: inositol-3-phosphate synthase [Deltaproteobacteria bacterium]TMB34617.1 MAG: inositol-3-phosphate synthase [Deltaproteobacteria bacterium]